MKLDYLKRAPVGNNLFTDYTNSTHSIGISRKTGLEKTGDLRGPPADDHAGVLTLSQSRFSRPLGELMSRIGCNKRRAGAFSFWEDVKSVCWAFQRPLRYNDF